MGGEARLRWWWVVSWLLLLLLLLLLMMMCGFGGDEFCGVRTLLRSRWFAFLPLHPLLFSLCH
ncbi:uncharacterized protein K452DRAFT_161777 [Aplosporella prunicola CBS 121167]|uniref:Uncharacterized protein n=1 Tax=Aplosporella prunicola CBS 121167 TaxID=1176127 RepID=A0A6A6BKE9_9PEZI|nr:uncharacterized protein K452DRAFT_161777 [Aplosporella prunicola CBS 121167]KAF2143754.1 hypothetical protein K452DRAFT_161777 [Aplosporella prunicola CBS 121167]